MKRRHVLALALVVAVPLVLLGAVPSYLGTGDPYYLVAEPVDDDVVAVDVDDLPEHRYPYTTAALEDGESEPYRTGAFGLKETFAHSPFDEVSALQDRSRAAVAGEHAVHVERNGTIYRLELLQRSG